MYYNGRGVPQDYAEAVKWWRAAAHWPEAQFHLAYSYNFGQGVPKDRAEAIKRYHIAAEQGLDAAQFLLGQRYHRGEEVPQDYAEAAKLFRMAAEQGFVMAQYRLGYMHAKGEGMPVNYVRAYMWWSLAKAQANKDVARNSDIIKAIKEAAENLDIIKEEMSPAQIAKAQELADEWRPDCESWMPSIDLHMAMWQSFAFSTPAEIAEEEARYTEYRDTCKPN